MRAVVTGGAGFLGSHLCDRLIAEGWEVLALDNFVTGAERNVQHLSENAAFKLEKKMPAKARRCRSTVRYITCCISPRPPALPII